MRSRHRSATPRTGTFVRRCLHVERSYFFAFSCTILLITIVGAWQSEHERGAKRGLQKIGDVSEGQRSMAIQMDCEHNIVSVGKRG
jgi:hypothetical protein